jgi:hypothetical protein
VLLGVAVDRAVAGQAGAGYRDFLAHPVAGRIVAVDERKRIAG